MQCGAKKYTNQMWKTRNQVLIFIVEYNAANGYSPTFREIGQALGLRSISTVSKYVHLLIEEGELAHIDSRPRTLTPKQHDGDIEKVQQRICLEIADGGKVYMDCNLEKPKAAPVKVSFEGILDAKSLKSRVGRIVGCNAEQ